jgi:hypothetical protein
MFQKRHYEVIARVLGTHKAKTDLIEAFIQTFEGDNWKFDSDKFWKAIYRAAGREYLLETR